jgi:hypothetical protein
MLKRGRFAYLIQGVKGAQTTLQVEVPNSGAASGRRTVSTMMRSLGVSIMGEFLDTRASRTAEDLITKAP